MSHPHASEGSEPPPFGQSKTLFVEEGNKACLLYVRRGGKERVRTVKFVTSLAAFLWCRNRGVGLVYSQPGQSFFPMPDPSLN